MRTFRIFLRSESGQGIVEYALIITIVSIVAISALALVGSKNNNSIANTASKVPG